MKVLLSTSFLTAASLLVGTVEAHPKKAAPREGSLSIEERHAAWIEHAKRQNPYPSGPGYDVPALADITMLTDGATATEPTVPLPTPAVPGQTPFPGAPTLPQVTINPADWPALYTVPPTNSPQVQQWLKELEGKTIPTWSRTTKAACDTDAAAAAEAGADKRCWWTCGGCTRSTDITDCKAKYDWGLTFDDGPAFYTPKLLTYLDSQSLKATFYLVGSNVISRPEMVQAEVMSGHELSVHTWSHTALTTLTNEQIVAELGWTREAIKRTTGLTPLTMRPPYGDIDDRVRAVSLAMGMVPVMWTKLPDGREFDSNDWRVHSGGIKSTEAKAQLDAALDQAGSLDHGVVVLEHDLYQESVDLAIGYTIPQNRARNPTFNMKPVTVCQNLPLSNSYLETKGNSTTPNPGTTTNKPTGTGATGTGTRTAGAGQATGTPGAASHIASAGGVVAVVVAVFGAFMTL